MSYEPTQQPDSGNDPPYGTPPQGPDPQNPYGTPPQEPYTPPQGPYPPPPETYGTPPQGTYTPPQQGPYGAPPQGPYGSAAAIAAPLPLGEAIRQLPSQYIKVVTKPSAATFAAEMGKAAWNIVWLQALILAAPVVIFFLLLGLLLPVFLASLPSFSPSGPARIASLFTSLFLGYAILAVVLVPLYFFAGIGIQYAIAGFFGGQGTFLAQSYTTLLYYVPLTVVLFIVALILGVAGSLISAAALLISVLIFYLLALAMNIYIIVLDIFKLMAVHRMGGGKATLVYFIPVLAILIPYALFYIILFSSALSHLPSPQPIP